MAEKKPDKTPKRRNFDPSFPRIADEQTKRQPRTTHSSLEECEQTFSQLSIAQQDRVLTTLQAHILRRRATSRN